ncbi:MAG: hypothetical protein ABSC08_02400 [Bryobacteraceae bacterium]
MILAEAMLDWLRECSYLAAWLAIPVAIVIGFLQNKKLGFEKFDWSRNLLCLTFLVALAVRFTPFVEKGMREDAAYVMAFLLAFLIIDRRPR